ncbi:ATP-binding protein [Ideonella margarita]|uniref:histidine kinase n=1 Tax=Ideonella margarita TaxID=2984191 RepID=A0ABU9C5U8_9BURK
MPDAPTGDSPPLSFTSIKTLLGDVLTGRADQLPEGDVQRLVADTLVLVGCLAAAMYLFTVLFMPMVSVPVRVMSGVLVVVPFLLRMVVVRFDHGVTVPLIMGVLMALGVVWVLSVGSVRTAHVSFFMLPLVFVGFLLGARMAWALLICVGGLLAVLAWLTAASPPVTFGAYAQAWVQFQFCAIVTVCALTLRRYLGQAHRQALRERDLRERSAEHQQALEAARQAADEANRAKTAFLANISHEIRTPMSAVIGLTDLALRSDDPAIVQEHVRRAHVAARGLLSLLNDVLDMSRIEAGKLTLEAGQFDLRGLVTDLHEMLEHRTDASLVSLRCEVDADVPAEAVGDPLRLHQVLLNLLSNALKFTPSGHVLLRVRALEPGVLRFEVQDTGVGMDAATLALAFDAFGQADASIARRHGGTGLGLTIARHLVRLMDAELQVCSSPGKGSTFWFDLPQPRTVSPAVLPPPPPPRLRAGARVLLVEDNETNQIIGEALLRQLGLEPVLATSGEQALALLAVEAVDAVLMDIQMPGMDGLTTTRRLRAGGGAQAALPVIAMTAHALAEEREASIAAGMNDHLSKPVTLHALAEALARVLPAD